MPSLIYKTFVFVLVTHGWLHAMDNNSFDFNKNRIKKSNKTGLTLQRDFGELTKYNANKIFIEMIHAQGFTQKIDTCPLCYRKVKKNYSRHLIYHLDDTGRKKYCKKTPKGSLSLNEEGRQEINDVTVSLLKTSIPHLLNNGMSKDEESIHNLLEWPKIVRNIPPRNNKFADQNNEKVNPLLKISIKNLLN